MSRNRAIPPEFWIWEAVIERAPMTRLLFPGLWTFANNFAVQPLRPRPIRMQVFHGDDWDRLQRAGKRARRRHPDISEADQRPTHSPPAAGSIANHGNPPIANHRNPPSTRGEEDWQAVDALP